MSLLDTAFSQPARIGARLRQFGKQDFAGVIKSASEVLVIRLSGAGLAYLSMVLLARWLGAFQFGIYAYVWVWVVVLIPPLSLGYTSAAQRFLPDYLARRKYRRIRGFLGQCYLVALSGSTIAAALGAELLFAFRDAVGPNYFLPLLAGLACLPFSVLSNQLEGIARAFGWVRLAFLPGYIFRPVFVLVIVGGAYWAGTAPSADDALLAVVTGSIAIALVQGALVIAGAKRLMPKCAPVRHTRHWATISLSFIMIDGCRMLLENSDMLLLGRLVSPDSVAVYFAAARTSGLIAALYFAVVALAVPKFSQIHAAGTRAEMQRFVSGISRLVFWPSLVAALTVACAGPFALSLFGGDFGAGYPVLLVVLAGLVVRAAVGPVEYLLNMTGHHRDTMRAITVAAAVNIALTLLLVPLIGIIGAALSNALALAGVSIWLAVMARRRLNIAVFVFA